MANNYGLIIGNGLYEHLDQLATPAADARAVARALADPVIGDYQCQVEINQESLYLRRVIEDLFVYKAKKDDTVLIYFSGHGLINDSGELHLATKDTDQKYLRATSISAEFIRRVMAECLAERKIIILDSCHSGAFSGGIKGELESATRARWQLGRGVAILTSSRQLQYSFEIAGLEEHRIDGLSVFTHFLIEGLEQGVAARNEHPYVTVNNLYTYVQEEMVRAEVNGQMPQISTIEQEGEIIIANNPHSPQFALPENIQSLAESSQRVELQQAIAVLGKYAQGENRFWARQAVRKLQDLNHHRLRMIQFLARQTLAEANRILPEPIIHFSSGEQIRSVADWVNLLEQNKDIWREASEYLYSGLLEEWLDHHNRSDLARALKRIRSQSAQDRLIELEQFQRMAGSLPAQKKADAITNMDDLLGKLIYWRLRKRQRPQDLQFVVTNQSRGYLHGELISKVNWIKINKPQFGCLPQDMAKVPITVELDRYKPYGIYPFPLDFSLG